MPCARLQYFAAVHLALGLSSGCISDHTVEADVRAAPGLVQPGASGGNKLATADACERLTSARAAAATKLGCDDPADQCPGYLRVAGSVPCDEVVASSVEACQALIEKYASCRDFNAKPCSVTAVSESCKTPAAPEAGTPVRDSAPPPPPMMDAERDAEANPSG
jgi:hypothetical protein